MRKAVLKRSREALEAMRAQLLRTVQQEIGGRDVEKDEGMDTYDLASDARDREISHILTDRDREKLVAIDEALSRVDDGSYGICEDCGAEIAEGRLQALPFTRLCVSCQGDRERESKLNRRYEEDKSFRRLGGGESDDEGS
jgi:RNA polymerase-binding transcription factor